MNNNTISIRIKNYKSLADCISIIRNYTNDSMGSIKTKIQSGEPVLACGYTDRIGLKKIIRCYYELTTKEITPTLHELDDDITTITFLENLSATYDDISNEIDSES